MRPEVLNHFIVFGEKHLGCPLREYLVHYNGEFGGGRPHQGIGNMPLSLVIPAPPPPGTASTGDVLCRERLGGLLKHYYHAAAA